MHFFYLLFIFSFLMLVEGLKDGSFYIYPIFIKIKPEKFFYHLHTFN
ncbi:hypothetical protein QY97_03494 [Bacillus thermotolerans]|nr:hypothetical protein QY97_03494 [Bacillus thermotolerans]